MAVEACPPAVISAFLRSARGRLAATPRDVTAAALLFRSLAALGRDGDQKLAPRLDRTLGEELKAWRRTDLNAVEDRLRHVDTGVADQFAGWRQKRLATPLRRSWRRLVTGHPEGGP
jgi:hypothetical protein